MSTVGLPELVAGFKAAHDRFDRAKLDRDPQGAFQPLFAALSWLVSIDEFLQFSPHPVMRATSASSSFDGAAPSAASAPFHVATLADVGGTRHPQPPARGTQVATAPGASGLRLRGASPATQRHSAVAYPRASQTTSAPRRVVALIAAIRGSRGV